MKLPFFDRDEGELCSAWDFLTENVSLQVCLKPSAVESRGIRREKPTGRRSPLGTLPGTQK